LFGSEKEYGVLVAVAALQTEPPYYLFASCDSGKKYCRAATAACCRRAKRPLAALVDSLPPVR